jgi:hypothetical protein
MCARCHLPRSNALGNAGSPGVGWVAANAYTATESVDLDGHCVPCYRAATDPGGSTVEAYEGEQDRVMRALVHATLANAAVTGGATRSDDVYVSHFRSAVALLEGDE